jgi:hypothetical protein
MGGGMPPGMGGGMPPGMGGMPDMGGMMWDYFKKFLPSKVYFITIITNHNE